MPTNLRFRPVLLAAAALALAFTAACSQQAPAPTSAPGGVAPAAVAPADSGETSPLLSVPPEALVWSQPGVTDARRQDDIQDCYAFARARVRSGQQIESDIQSNLNQPGAYSPSRQFQGRLDDYGSRNRQDRLFRDCMASKGYIRGQAPEQTQPAQ